MDKRLVNFLADEGDIAEWNKAAKADNRTLSAWIRDRLCKLAAKENKAEDRRKAA